MSELGLPRSERNLIEGLNAGPHGARSGLGVTEAQLASIVRLARDPPPEFGVMQGRTGKALLRPYPLGLRFSGSNMSPVPAYVR